MSENTVLEDTLKVVLFPNKDQMGWHLLTGHPSIPSTPHVLTIPELSYCDGEKNINKNIMSTVHLPLRQSKKQSANVSALFSKPVKKVEQIGRAHV